MEILEINGLCISLEKTNCMCGNTPTPPIPNRSSPLNQEESLKYLGSILFCDGFIEKDTSPSKCRLDEVETAVMEYFVTIVKSKS